MQKNIAVKVSVVTIIINILLSAFKFFAGIMSNSSALISDAVHSLSDVLSTFIVIAGARMGGKKSDPGHPYGHERLENIASVILSIMLFATGAGIGITAIKTIMVHEYALTANRNIAIAAAVVSIFTKEWMYHYTKNAAKKIKSDSLMADAWHHRSDALSSIGSLIGVVGAKFGIGILDPIAGIIICIFIIKVSVNIFIDSSNKLIDKACDTETIMKISKAAGEVDGVIRVDLVNTRIFGAKVYVDLEFSANPDITLRSAHAIAQAVHDKIEAEFDDVKHCMVHVNPYENE